LSKQGCGRNTQSVQATHPRRTQRLKANV